MKLVLASQGFTTSDIADAVAKLAGTSRSTLNVAIINEAYVPIEPGHDESWLINELSLIKKHVGGTIAFVNLRAYDISEVKQRLEFADLIYIVGGAQVVLPTLFRQTGFDKMLQELAESKVIMGTSAGANVLGRQIEDMHYWEDQYGPSEEYLASPSLGLVNFNILPHYEREDHPRRTASVLEPLLKENPFLLYGVNDTQAVLWDGSEVQFIGGQPATFGSR